MQQKLDEGSYVYDHISDARAVLITAECESFSEESSVQQIPSNLKHFNLSHDII